MRASVDVGCVLRGATQVDGYAHAGSAWPRGLTGTMSTPSTAQTGSSTGGLCLGRYASLTTVYILYERGESNDSALVADDANHNKSNGRLQNPHSICAHSFVNV